MRLPQSASNLLSLQHLPPSKPSLRRYNAANTMAMSADTPLFEGFVDTTMDALRLIEVSSALHRLFCPTIGPMFTLGSLPSIDRPLVGG